MGIDEVITLDDKKQYLLLLETAKEGIKYFLACEIVNEEETENYTILKEIQESDGFYVEEVEDQELKNELLATYEQMLDDADEEDEEEANN